MSLDASETRTTSLAQILYCDEAATFRDALETIGCYNNYSRLWRKQTRPQWQP